MLRVVMVYSLYMVNMRHQLFLNTQISVELLGSENAVTASLIKTGEDGILDPTIVT